MSRSSRHLSRRAITPGAIGPETPLDPQSLTLLARPAMDLPSIRRLRAREPGSATITDRSDF